MESVKRGDTEPIQAILRRYGKVLDLTGALVVYGMRLAHDPDAETLTGSCLIVDDEKGLVEFGEDRTGWVAGVYIVEFQVTFAPGTADETFITVPSDGFEHLEVIADLVV